MPRPKKTRTEPARTLAEEQDAVEDGVLIVPRPPYHLMNSRTELKTITSQAGGMWVSVENSVTAATKSLTQLDVVVRGTGSDQRIGARFLLKKLRIFAYVHPTVTPDLSGPPLSAPSPTVSAVRYMVVWDRAPNQTAAKYGDIFPVLGSAVYGGAFALPKVDTFQRFDILKDVVILAGPRVTSAAAYYSANNVNVPAADRILQFDIDMNHLAVCTASDSTGTTAGRVSGCLYVLAMGQYVDATPYYSNGEEVVAGTLPSLADIKGTLHGCVSSYQLFFEDQ